MSQPFSIFGELRRYGLHGRDVVHCILWALIALALTVFVLPEQGKYAFQYLVFHLALLGLGVAIFSRTILGRDDFFKSMDQDSCRNLVLCLFFPPILHGLSCFALLPWVIFPGSFSQAWRFLYGYLAVFAVAQSAFSFRALFVLAITRLTHQERTMFPPPLPNLLDPESVDEVMAANGQAEESIANDLWERLRPLLMPGDSRMKAAGVVISMAAKYGQDDHHSLLLMADYTGELPDEPNLMNFELCDYETCRQPATWHGYVLRYGKTIPVCNHCVVEVDNPVLI